jgi:hypothetical protein
LTKKKEENEIVFKLHPVKEKPKRKFSKPSKYDQPIDAFLQSDNKLAKIDFEEKEANYLKLQLAKRIEIRNLQDQIEVSTINNECYLERLTFFKE